MQQSNDPMDVSIPIIEEPEDEAMPDKTSNSQPANPSSSKKEDESLQLVLVDDPYFSLSDYTTDMPPEMAKKLKDSMNQLTREADIRRMQRLIRLLVMLARNIKKMNKWPSQKALLFNQKEKELRTVIETEVKKTSGKRNIIFDLNSEYGNTFTQRQAVYGKYFLPEATLRAYVQHFSSLSENMKGPKHIDNIDAAFNFCNTLFRNWVSAFKIDCFHPVYLELFYSFFEQESTKGVSDADRVFLQHVDQVTGRVRYYDPYLNFCAEAESFYQSFLELHVFPFVVPVKSEPPERPVPFPIAVHSKERVKDKAAAGNNILYYIYESAFKQKGGGGGGDDDKKEAQDDKAPSIEASKTLATHTDTTSNTIALTNWSTLLETSRRSQQLARQTQAQIQQQEQSPQQTAPSEKKNLSHESQSTTPDWKEDSKKHPRRREYNRKCILEEFYLINFLVSMAHFVGLEEGDPNERTDGRIKKTLLDMGMSAVSMPKDIAEDIRSIALLIACVRRLEREQGAATHGMTISQLVDHRDYFQRILNRQNKHLLTASETMDNAAYQDSIRKSHKMATAYSYTKEKSGKKTTQVKRRIHSDKSDKTEPKKNFMTISDLRKKYSKEEESIIETETFEDPQDIAMREMQMETHSLTIRSLKSQLELAKYQIEAFEEKKKNATKEHRTRVCFRILEILTWFTAWFIGGGWLSMIYLWGAWKAYGTYSSITSYFSSFMEANPRMPLSVALKEQIRGDMTEEEEVDAIVRISSQYKQGQRLLQEWAKEEEKKNGHI
jgi:hypothetical protein